MRLYKSCFEIYINNDFLDGDADEDELKVVDGVVRIDIVGVLLYGEVVLDLINNEVVEDNPILSLLTYKVNNWIALCDFSFDDPLTLVCLSPIRSL